MSITVSSTTDSQDAVNAAAGIITAEVPETTPPAAPQEQPREDAGRPTPDDEPEEGDDDEQEDGGEHPETPQQPKRKGGWQRKIEALNRQNGYAVRRIQELEQALAQRAGEPQQRQQQQPAQAPQQGRPTQDQFETYEAFHEALLDWKFDQRQAQAQQIYSQMQRQQAEAQAVAQFQQGAREFAASTPDFSEVMASVSHIPIPPAFKEVLFSSPASAQVAYELAKKPEELERLTQLAPMEAAREIGRIEARLGRPAPATRQAALQKLPPQPIRPVGQGAATRTQVPLDEAEYQDFKARREQQIAARRGR